MNVLVRCTRCGEEFQDFDDVFHLRDGSGDTNFVLCDCGSVFRLTLSAELTFIDGEKQTKEEERCFGKGMKKI